MLPTKVCPIVFQDPTASKIMVFRHPSAGIQLVKGSIEFGERPADAALRELREESGIADAAVCQDLRLRAARHDGQIWSLQLCTVSRVLPKSWYHRCEDDGGLDLYFFWHDLDAKPSEDWHSIFRRALEFIRWRIKAMPESAVPYRRQGF